jgi:DNA-binding MarR family transcriptional regulator
MNKLNPPLAPLSEHAGAAPKQLFDAPDVAVVSQAKTLDSTLMGIARSLLIDDDPASELPLRQLRVCMALYEEPRSMSVLSRELGFSLSAMTQIADRLERAGLVTRWFEGPDRRVRRLRLTPRARRMLRVREESRIFRIAAMLGRIPPEDRDETLRVLDSLRHAAESQATRGGGQSPEAWSGP